MTAGGAPARKKVTNERMGNVLCNQDWVKCNYSKMIKILNIRLLRLFKIVNRKIPGGKRILNIIIQVQQKAFKRAIQNTNIQGV